MKYALLMYADPGHTREMTQAQLTEVLAKHEARRDELIPSGELIGGAGLALPEETVLLRLGGAAPSRGPLAGNAVEHLTAYYEVDCASQERAVEIASRLLDHHVTSVEVRFIHDSAPKP